MDATTVWILAGMLAMYAIGKGIGRAQGRAQGRRERMPPLALTLELEGEVIGGLHISGVQVSRTEALDPEAHRGHGCGLDPTEAKPDLPPGHPERLDP
ncbi:membrane protein [Mycobacterium phage Indlovu]|nr:membrane protein [Mycobacterium phage Indlovu]